MSLLDFPQAEVFELKDILPISTGESTISAILKKGTAKMVLRSLDEGQEVAAHTTSAEAFVQVLSGTAEMDILGTNHVIKAGECIVVPSNAKHDLRAKTAIQVLLLVVA